MNTENMLRKIDWAEIAGECIGYGNEVGYLKAMLQYDALEKRLIAEQDAETLLVWNRTSRALKNSTISWALNDDRHVQDSYRAMVRANSRIANVK